MNIIERYKQQVNKTYKNLCQQGVMTQDEAQYHLNIQSQSSFSTNNNQQNLTSQQYNENPYKKKKQQTSILPRIGKCIACPQKAKYRCPKCLVFYCSSLHYKSHNLFCSQQFYKKQVEQQMKSIKAPKQQKQKTLEYLKQHNELIGEQNQSKINQINQERLIKILQKIQQSEQNGKQIKIQQLNLTNQQQKLFHQYINKLQVQVDNDQNKFQQNNQGISLNSSQSNKQSNSLMICPAFWQIPDGLDFYFMQSIQIQQFSSSKYPQFIAYRQNASKRYYQLPQLNKLIGNKILSDLFKQDIFQHLIIGTLLFRIYNCQIKTPQQINQFVTTFIQIKQKQLCKKIQQGQFKISQLSSYTLAFIRQNIIQIKQKQIMNLLNQWYQFSILDCKKIVKNRYLLIQSFIRLLQILQKNYRIVSEKYYNLKKNQQKNNQKNKQQNQFQNPKQLVKVLNQMTKQIKKIQLILSYLKYQIQNNSSSRSHLFGYFLKNLIIEENRINKIKNDNLNYKNAQKQNTEISKNGIKLL